MEENEIISLAKEVRENAYAKYTNYKVGAVLVTKNGKVFSGCNVENNGIMSICAERVAFSKAISEGEKSFEKILVLGGKDVLKKTLPCGYCRQFISEFVEKDFKVQIYYPETVEEFTLEELLPETFNM